MGLIGNYIWACGRCRGSVHNHAARDDVRRRIDKRLVEISLTATGELMEMISQLQSIRDRLVSRASGNTIRRAFNEVNREISRDFEKNAFEIIYRASLLEDIDATSLSVGELSDTKKSEEKLRSDVAKQHQTVFWERNLTTLIRNSVERRQNAYKRRLKDVDLRVVGAEEAVYLWTHQEGRCAGCKDALFWNWAIGGRACLAQLDRVDVTKTTYVNNSAWSSVQ